jgi:hypothetical protein
MNGLQGAILNKSSTRAKVDKGITKIRNLLKTLNLCENQNLIVSIIAAPNTNRIMPCLEFVAKITTIKSIRHRHKNNLMRLLNSLEITVASVAIEEIPKNAE